MKQERQGFPGYKKSDMVMVIAGKYKGKTGKIMRLIKDKGQVVVEKINMVKRHTKPSQDNPTGGIIEKEAPMHVCKVLPVSAKTGKPMRFGKWLRENGREATPTAAKTKSAKAASKGKERGAK